MFAVGVLNALEKPSFHAVNLAICYNLQVNRRKAECILLNKARSALTAASRPSAFDIPADSPKEPQCNLF
jgi:hypothetical protein